MESSSGRSVWTAFGTAVIAAVVIGTMWPDATVNTSNFVPLREHAEALGCVITWCDTALKSTRFVIVDVAGNVVVFVPIGMALAGMLGGTNRQRFWTAVAMGSGLSLLIEIAQSAIPTRATDIDDLVFNTLGTAIGAGLLVWWQRRHPASPA